MMYSYKESGIEWLGKVPEHWTLDRVKDVVTLRDEKCVVRSDELNYLELEDLSQGTGQVLSFRDTLGVASAVQRFRKGDVLFGKLRPYLEKYYLTQEDGYCTGEILPLVPKRVNSAFFKYFVGSPNFIAQCTVLAYGAKMPRVNWQKQIGLFLIPLPPPEEQAAIAAYLDHVCAKLDRIIGLKGKAAEGSIMHQQTEILRAYRKSLIHECVTGKKQVFAASRKKRATVG